MKVNDYVRTKYGNIGQILEVSKNIVGTIKYLVKWNNCKAYYVSQVKDYQSSPNIIDLIRVGDIIKYHPVQNNYVKTNILYKAIKNERELIELEYDITHNKKSIISIVTKEQFERCEYNI